MEGIKSYKLILNSKEFELPLEFSQRASITPQILTALQKEGKYLVQSKVNEEVLQSFIQYLSNNQEPQITDDNRSQFSELSKEFQVMGNLLDLPIERPTERRSSISDDNKITIYYLMQF